MTSKRSRTKHKQLRKLFFRKKMEFVHFCGYYIGKCAFFEDKKYALFSRNTYFFIEKVKISAYAIKYEKSETKFYFRILIFF